MDLPFATIIVGFGSVLNFFPDFSLTPTCFSFSFLFQQLGFGSSFFRHISLVIVHCFKKKKLPCNATLASFFVLFYSALPPSQIQPNSYSFQNSAQLDAPKSLVVT